MSKFRITVSPLDLATGLEYANVYKIRELIEDLIPQLRKLRGIPPHQGDIQSVAGRPGKTYWLNAAQAYLVCANTRIPCCRVSLITGPRLYALQAGFCHP